MEHFDKEIDFQWCVCVFQERTKCLTRILRDKKTGTLPLHPPNKCKRNKGIITVLAENSPMFIVVLKSNCAITTIVL